MSAVFAAPMPHRTTAILFLLSLGMAGCGASPLFSEAPPDAASALLIESGDSLGLIGVDLSTDGPSTELVKIGSDGVVLIVYFAQPVEALQLGPGPIQIPVSGAPSRAIPTPRLSVQRSILESNSLGPWESIDVADPVLDDFKLPMIDRSRCWAQGGCTQLDAEVPICDLDCAPEELSEPEPPMMPTPPREVVRPSFVDPTTGSCAAGTVEQMVQGARLCEPMAESETSSCTAGEGLFFGEGCAEVASCPASLFPQAASGAVYVAETGDDSPPSDGSMNAPFRTVEYAVAVVPAGGVVAVGKGRYPERFAITKDVEIVGACPGETAIDGGGLVVRGGVRVTLRGLTLSSQGWIGLSVESGASLDGRELIIESTSDQALLLTSGSNAFVSRAVLRSAPDFDGVGVYASTLEIEDASIFGGRSAIAGDGSEVKVTARTIAAIGGSEAGLHVLNGAKIDVQGIFATGLASGAWVTTGSELTLSDATFVNMSSFGLQVNGAHVTVSRAFIEDTAREGLIVHDGGEASVSDVFVSRSGLDGIVVDNSTATAARAMAAQAARHGMVGGGNAFMQFSDAIVEDTGDGAVHLDGVVGKIDGLLIQRSPPFGLTARGGELELSDATIRSTVSEDQGGISALQVVDGRLVASRVLIEEAKVGAQVLGSTADLHLVDARVVGTASAAAEISGGKALIERLHSEDCGSGVFVNDATGARVRVELTDLYVDSLREVEAVIIRDSSEVTIERSEILGPGNVAVAVGQTDASSGTQVSMSDARIVGFARGLLISEDIEGTLSRSVIENTSRAAIYVHSRGALTASRVRLGPSDGSGAGFGIFTQGTTTVSDFFLFGHRYGIAPAEPANVLLVRGAIHDNETAIDASGCLAPLRLEEVQLYDNMQDVNGELCDP